MNSPKPHSILLIMGSVRAGRRCPQIATWVRRIAERLGSLSVETIDLRDWHLPANDEPGIPAQGIYKQEHTRTWSAKVAGADGVVFVTPQYNWGYPAPLKNAIDHLCKEWAGKPLAIVTYGGHGGEHCAAQIRQIMVALKTRPVTTMPAITIARELIINNAEHSDRDLMPFEPAVVQAMSELSEMLI